MLINPKESPFNIFRHYATFSERKFFFKFFLFSVEEKWFPIFIGHEKHTLGVSKLFSELFINTSWACFKNCAFGALDIAPILDVLVLVK